MSGSDERRPLNVYFHTACTSDAITRFVNGYQTGLDGDRDRVERIAPISLSFHAYRPDARRLLNPGPLEKLMVVAFPGPSSSAFDGFARTETGRRFFEDSASMLAASDPYLYNRAKVLFDKAPELHFPLR